ncbi:MAG TPA: hypothetical protein DCM31_05270 [Deferribacteraceae bacterium]|nr:hypothetical protein [Deferribacteraceae bacterium]
MKKILLLAAAMFILGCGAKTNIEKVNYSKNFSPSLMSKVAVLDFGVSKDVRYDSSGIADRFTAELVGSELFTVVDRKDVDKVMREMGYQIKNAEIGTLDDKTIQKLRQIGADTLLTGKLISFKQDFKGRSRVYSEAHLTAKLIRIETGEVVWSAEMLKSSKPDKIRKEAAHPEELLSDMIRTMCVPLKTENKFRRIIKM